MGGGIHGVAQIIETVSGKVLKKFRDNRVGHILCVAVVFIFCNLAWVFFRAENFMDAIYVISNILNGILNPASYLSSKLMSIPQFLLLMCYIAVLAIYDFENYKLGVTEYLNNKPTLVRWVCYVFIGLLVVFGSQKGVAAEFVYFQF
jgi:hypothetical protein